MYHSAALNKPAVQMPSGQQQNIGVSNVPSSVLPAYLSTPGPQLGTPKYLNSQDSVANTPLVTSTRVQHHLDSRSAPYPPTQSTPYPSTQSTSYPPTQSNPYPPTQSTPYPPTQRTPYPPTQSTPYSQADSTVQLGPVYKQSNSSTVPPFMMTSHNSSGPRSPQTVLEKDVLTLVRTKDGERRQILTILLQENTNSTNHSKEIYIQVTDKRDPFLFFSLCLTEDDFLHLKSNQGLLVDFSSFPGMLRQLLEKCGEEGESTSPAFILILNMSQANPSLEFTELNLFKHLCHLSLIVVKASDTQLKDYLVECIKHLQSDLLASTSQLSQLQQQLSDCQRRLEQQAAEMTAVRRQQQETSSSLGQKMMSDLQTEREMCNKKIADMQNRFELERRDGEARHMRSLEQLENRVASLDVQNRDLLEGKYRGESALRELRGKLVSREEELKNQEAEIHSLDRDKGILETRGREDARRIAELEKQVHSLGDQLRDREKDLQRSRDLASQAQAERDALGLELKEKTGTVGRRETAVRSVTEELMKANEIIRKLQDQVKQEQNKSKLRGKIAAEQEKLLGDKDQELGQVREQLQRTAQTTDSKEKQLADREQQLKDVEERNGQLEKMNRSNENVINWLNKQLAAFKSTEHIIASSRGGGTGRGRGRGEVARRSTSDVNNDASKENDPIVGLDPKYFEHSTPGGTVARCPIPDVSNLPTNVRRGGLLRK